MAHNFNALIDQQWYEQKKYDVRDAPYHGDIALAELSNPG